MSTFHLTEDQIRAIGRLMARAQDVEEHLRLPVEFMVPQNFLPTLLSIGKHKIVRGDRFAVLVAV